jgi:hypothetical protein
MSDKSNWKNKNRDILKGVKDMVTSQSALAKDVAKGVKDLITTPTKIIKKNKKGGRE